MLKDQLLKTNGLQFDNWRFGPETLFGLPRNRSLDISQHWRVMRNSLIRQVKHPTFLSHGGQAELNCFLFKLSSHHHFYIVKYRFTRRDDY